MGRKEEDLTTVEVEAELNIKDEVIVAVAVEVEVKEGEEYRPYQRQKFFPRIGEYKYEEWISLSREQQSRIQDLRDNVRDNNSRSNYQTNDRNIRQMSQDDKTIPLQVRLPSAPSNITPTPPYGDQGSSVRGRNDRAGDAFSSDHSRRK